MSPAESPDNASVSNPPTRIRGRLVAFVVGLAALGCAHGGGSTLPRADEVYAEGPLARDARDARAASAAGAEPNPVAAFYRSSAMLAVGAPISDGVPPVDQDADDSTEPSDLAITGIVRAAIARDALLSARALDVQVETRDGTVILRGHAVSHGERARVERHARSAPGVREVVNVIAIDR